MESRDASLRCLCDGRGWAELGPTAARADSIVLSALRAVEAGMVREVGHAASHGMVAMALVCTFGSARGSSCTGTGYVRVPKVVVNKACVKEWVGGCV